MRDSRLFFLGLLLLGACAVQAGDLLQQDFSGAGVPKDWVPGGRAGSWTVVDGVLQGVCPPDDGHGPSISTPLVMKSGSVEYRVKLDVDGHCLMLIDGDSAFGGQAHLLRVGLRPGMVVLQQDRGAPASKIAQKKEADEAKAAGKPAPKVTAEQLADPAFYRIEKIEMAKDEAWKAGEWLTVKMQFIGNAVTLWMNGKEVMKGKGTVLDVPKAKLVFLVGLGKKVWIDDVKAAAE